MPFASTVHPFQSIFLAFSQIVKERMQKEFTLVIQRVNRFVINQSHSMPAIDDSSSSSSSPEPSMATARNGFIKISPRDAKLMQDLIQVMKFVPRNVYFFISCRILWAILFYSYI